MMNILPDLAQAKDFVDKGTSMTNVFIGSVVSALITQFGAGARSASITTAGQAATDIHYVLSQLNLKGYKAELQTGNILAVRW